ncbi:MAG TPA: Ig-like domain-containing protein, partial [Dongiaceae bacterium]|nr:Ig-like domain-containing protein [Dongiaceae bacterium]
NGGFSATPGWDFTTGFGSVDVAAAAAFTRPTIDFSASPAIVAPGGTVVLSATIVGNDPTGAVQFLVNGAALGSPVALVGGSAAIAATAPVTAGTVVFGAAYAGDFYNAGSMSTTRSP